MTVPCKFTGISLFCSGGIGDLAAEDAGIDILLANELLEDRSEVFSFNYPNAAMVQGDIEEKKTEIVNRTKQLLQKQELDFVFATPPCQGMSSNGKGKLLNSIRKGLKPKLDVRNRLIIPTLEIVKALRPKTIVFENVPAMRDTVIEDYCGEMIRIVDYIRRELGPDYTGSWDVVEFANYGVPQRRKRLITIFSREESISKYLKKYGKALPQETHSGKNDERLAPWLTVRDIISNFPPLDAKSRDTSTSLTPFHRVPLLDAQKYFWVSNTPHESGAFDNQCVKCGCQSNPTHRAVRDNKGVNRSSKSTPIKCIQCNELLPRPCVRGEDGEYRLMNGFTSAYKRMAWDKPASALTRNLSYACSDHKLHPEQNRVLSLHEAFHLHTISDFPYEWKRRDGKKISDKTVREIIGESIPPRGLTIIYTHLIQIIENKEPPRTIYTDQDCSYKKPLLS